jgi:ankyrin repeat protein
MSSRLVKSTVLLLLALAPLACSGSRDRARARLGAMNIDYSDQTFVDRAAAGDVVVVRDFLTSGMKPGVINKEGKTALIAAAEQGKAEVVQLLLASGAQVNERDRKFRTTPIVWAASQGRTEVVSLLLSKGANPKAREIKAGMTAMLAAASHGHAETVRLLVENGAPVDDIDKDGRTPLMFASQTGQTDTVKLLLEKGADLKRREKIHGADAFLTASANGRTDVVKLLLDKGVDVHTCDVDQKTALMWAATNGHSDTVKLLLDHGLDPSTKDGSGKTAAVLAMESKKVAVAEMLKAAALPRS